MAILSISSKINHQVRFLLFEIGILLEDKAINQFIIEAKRQTLKKLKNAARSENLNSSSFNQSCPLDYLQQLKAETIKDYKASVFWSWSRLFKELEESVSNAALALAYRQKWNQTLCQSGAKDILDYARHQLNPANRLTFFEQWGASGHPYHPNSHAKIGFSTREVMQYSPEFQSRFNIHWLALDKQFALTARHDYLEFIERAFPREYALWQEHLYHQHVNHQQYYPLPVHPWQLRNTISKKFAEQLNEQVIITTRCQQTVSPSMSFRTVIPSTLNSPHIKLATAIHTTSAMRTVSPGSVHNGPRLSQVLNTLLDAENHFEQRLFLAADLNGIHAEHSDGKHLAALFRTNPNQLLKANETAIPLATLFEVCPISHRPLITLLIKESGLNPYDYFERYCYRLLCGQLPLYIKFGVALEAHQQNTLMVFNDKGEPVKHINRDLGGIRIHRPLLQMAGYLIALEKNSLIDTADFGEVRNKFVHSNLQSNLEYVIATLSESIADVSKGRLYQITRDIIEQIMYTLKPAIGNKRYECEREALFNQPWQKKSLLRMRLEPCHGNYLYQSITNPFKQYT